MAVLQTGPASRPDAFQASRISEGGRRISEPGVRRTQHQHRRKRSGSRTFDDERDIVGPLSTLVEEVQARDIDTGPRLGWNGEGVRCFPSAIVEIVTREADATTACRI